MPTEQDTALLAAALGVHATDASADVSMEARLNARINELEARIASQQQTIDAQQQTIATLTAEMRERTGEQAENAVTFKALETRVAQLEGEAPTVAGGYRASVNAPQAPAALAANAPYDDPLDSFLGG